MRSSKEENQDPIMIGNLVDDFLCLEKSKMSSKHHQQKLESYKKMYEPQMNSYETEMKQVESTRSTI